MGVKGCTNPVNTRIPWLTNNNSQHVDYIDAEKKITGHTENEMLRQQQLNKLSLCQRGFCSYKLPIRASAMQKSCFKG